MIDEILKDIGLTTDEIEIYSSLIRTGPQSAIALSKSTKVKRTYVYAVSESLVKRGLVSKEIKGRTTIFHPRSPDMLLSLAQTKKEKVIASANALESILEELKTSYRSIETRPVVTYFEGVEGVKKVYQDTLKYPGPLLALAQVSEVDEKVHEWLKTEYVSARKKANLNVKVIISSGGWATGYSKLNAEELRETRQIDSTKFPLAQEINIYGDKLALINNQANTNLLGIIIDHPLVAQTFRSWFELTWEHLGEKLEPTEK